jgi:apolipoprotein N-acyltransferase
VVGADVVGRMVAVVLGAGLFALALPPFDHAALAWLTLVPLLLAVRGRPVLSGLGYGILYGSAWGWTVTGWSVQAVERYFGFGTPLTVLAMCVFYAVVSAPTFGLFGAGAARLLGARSRLVRQLALPALWVAGELLRGRLVEQPWGLLGYTQHAHPGLLQIAAVTGVYGVSFVLAFGNVALVEALGAPPGRQRLRMLAVPLALIAAVWTGGAAFASRGVIGASPRTRSRSCRRTSRPPTSGRVRTRTASSSPTCRRPCGCRRSRRRRSSCGRRTPSRTTSRASR